MFLEWWNISLHWWPFTDLPEIRLRLYSNGDLNCFIHGKVRVSGKFRGRLLDKQDKLSSVSIEQLIFKYIEESSVYPWHRHQVRFTKMCRCFRSVGQKDSMFWLSGLVIINWCSGLSLFIPVIPSKFLFKELEKIS